jgi:hypothetical protein
VGARDEVSNHLLGVLEVRDHSAAHRTHGDDVGRRPAEHPPRFFADSEDLACPFADRDHRWFVEHDAATADVDQRVRSAEVDADVG